MVDRGKTLAIWLGAAIITAAGGCYTGLGGAARDGGGDAGGADDGTVGGASEDGGSDDGAANGCTTVDVGHSPLRRLTRAQYGNSIRDLLGVDIERGALPEDERADAVGPFASNVLAPVSDNVVRDYMNAAEQAVALAGDALPLPCDPVAVGDSECAHQFIVAFGRRVYRRALTDDEIADYDAMFAGAGPDETFTARIGLVAETMLQSPDFLYLVELGAADSEGDVVALADDEIAARLSFFLWSSTPDDPLLDAAAAGALRTDEGLREQAERLLASDRARDSIASFHTQWLKVDRLAETEKSPDDYPEYDATLAAAMVRETEDFADWVLRAGDGRLATLLTASFTVADPQVLALYGVDAADVDADGIAQLDATQRAGLLTHASVLSAHAHADQASLVRRGALVRKNLLCQPLPPPPPDVDITPPPIDPNTPTRARFDQHRDDPSCSGCHDLIDPIGYGLLAYDGIGRRMEMDGNQPIDESGRVVGIDDGSDGSFVGPVELAARLADSEMVRDCVAQQWVTFALGHPLGEGDTCSVDSLAQSFSQSDGDIPELLLAIVTSDAFRYRRIAD